MMDRIRKGVAHFICIFRFKSIGKHSYVLKPIRIVGGKNISIGDYCSVMNGARIEAISEYGGERYKPAIHIGNHVDIGQWSHITAASELFIGDGTSILPNVLITDIDHKTEGIDVPPANQSIVVKRVKIGKNCLIGMGARILPGVEIGDGCVVGTNAVVSKSVPSYTIVAGIPAQIIKKYNFEQKCWDRV